jgi:hypothetical protein
MNSNDSLRGPRAAGNDREHNEKRLPGYDVILQQELEGLDTYIKKSSKFTTPLTPHRIIFALGIAYHYHGGKFIDPLRSNLGMLVKWLTEVTGENSDPTQLTIVIAFDPYFNELVEKAGPTRLEYDIQQISKFTRNAVMNGNSNFNIWRHGYGKRSKKNGALWILPIGKTANAQAYHIGPRTILVCLNRSLNTSYPTESANASKAAQAKIGSTLQSYSESCPPKPGTDYELLLNFCQKHKFQEIGIYNCAYVDERFFNNTQKKMVSIRTNAYFDNMCELLYIAYSCGAYRFLLDLTMGSYSHPDSLIKVNRRVKFFNNNDKSSDNGRISYKKQRAFLTLYPLDEKTKFKLGYPISTFDGGRRTTMKKKLGKGRKGTRKHK